MEKQTRWVTGEAVEVSPLPEKTPDQWTTHETWVTYRWLTEDENWRRVWETRAAEIARTAGGYSERAVQELARGLLEAVEDECLKQVTGLAGDLIYSALAEVVWCEVARGILKTHPPSEPAPDSLFSLGDVVATPGVLRTVPFAEREAALARHARGDWGDIPPEDRAENEEALREGYRLFSAYRTAAGEKLCVITEDDRSVTTLLLPDEY